MNSVRIEKRLPFGFRGDWGKLYKRYTADEELKTENEVLKIQENYYVEIGQNVQFKQTAEESFVEEQTAQGLVQNIEYIVVETTDACWDYERKEWRCVVSIGDVVKIFNRSWIVTAIKAVYRYTPARQGFYYCDLKSIM